MSALPVTQLNPTPKLTLRLAVTATALGMAAIVAAVAGFIWSDRQQRLDRLEQESASLARSVATVLGDRLRRVDEDLIQLRETISQHREAASHSSPPHAGERGAHGLSTIPYPLSRGLQWVAADGSVQSAQAPVQPGGADFNAVLAFHRVNSRDELLVGVMQPSATNGRPVLPVSRAVRGVDGSFAGVVIGVLPIDDIDSDDVRARLSSQWVLGIADAQGTLLARWPHLPGATGRYGLRWDNRAWGTLPTAQSVRTFVTRSPSDGVERLFAQAAAQNQLLVTVGASLDETLALWRKSSLTAAGVGLMAMVLGLLLVHFLRKAGQREARLRTELAATMGDLQDYHHALDEHAIVCTTDETGAIVHANANFCKVMHYPLEDLLGRNSRIFNSGVQPRDFFDQIRQEVLSGKTFRGTVCDRDRQGRLHWFDLTVLGVRTDAQGPHRFLSVRTNITESRRVAQTLEHELSASRAANAALNVEATTDALTGLLNRRAFDDAAQVLLDRAASGQETAALMMIDVDLFKRYNDSLGHAAGDEALRQVAQALRGALRRAKDRVFRYGGEEFAVLVSGATPEACWDIAEALRVAVSNLALPHPEHPQGRVTISLGLRSATASVPLASVEQWIASADAALYQAKRQGRNRCLVAPQTADPGEHIPSDATEPGKPAMHALSARSLSPAFHGALT